MNAINKAINDVKYFIPREILDKAFIDRSYSYFNTENTNIDEQIRQKVIKQRVIVDTNLVGGKQAVIPLSGLKLETFDNLTTIVHVPKVVTNNRTILSVLDVAFISAAMLNQQAGGYGAMQASNPVDGQALDNGALMSAMTAVMNAGGKLPVVSTADAELVGENTVMIRGVTLVQNMFLRCMLSNDEELNDIHPRSIIDFSKLVELAVKSYIYNKLIVRLDTGEIFGGAQLGVFKTLIEGYADAEANYKDFLEQRWAKVTFINDHVGYRRFLRTLVGAQT